MNKKIVLNKQKLLGFKLGNINEQGAKIGKPAPHVVTGCKIGKAPPIVMGSKIGKVT